jgi:hypothetical protein
LAEVSEKLGRVLGSDVLAPPVELKTTRLLAKFIPHVTSNLTFNTSHCSGPKEHRIQSDQKLVADAQKCTASVGNEFSRKVPLRGVGLIVAMQFGASQSQQGNPKTFALIGRFQT